MTVRFGSGPFCCGRPDFGQNRSLRYTIKSGVGALRFRKLWSYREAGIALPAALLICCLDAFGAVRAFISPLAVFGLGRAAPAAIRGCHAVRIFLPGRNRASVRVNLNGFLTVGANNFAIPVGNAVSCNGMCAGKKH